MVKPTFVGADGSTASPERFVRLRLFGIPNSNEYYLWGVYPSGRRYLLMKIQTVDATLAGYLMSQLAFSRGQQLEIAGARQ